MRVKKLIKWDSFHLYDVNWKVWIIIYCTKFLGLQVGKILSFDKQTDNIINEGLYCQRKVGTGKTSIQLNLKTNSFTCLKKHGSSQSEY